MFDDKEIEELYSEFLSLDGKMLLDSDENVNNLDGDFITSDKFLSFPNLRNNNFIFNNSGASVKKLDAGTELDIINKNFISLEVSEYDKSSENTMIDPGSGATEENTSRVGLHLDKKGNEIDNEIKDIDEKLISPDNHVKKDAFHHNGWPPDSLALWHSGPSSLNLGQTSSCCAPFQDLTLSVTSNLHGPNSMSNFSSSSKRTYSHQQLGAKVEMVYSLLSMLDTDNREDMSKTFLAMSSSAESCHALRQSGCLPLLIQLIHSYELNKEVRQRAAEALHNIVYAQTDEKRRKKEVRVLKSLEQVREYCDELRNDCTEEMSQLQESEKHPINAIGTLMKFSFDAEHRQAICVLGGLHAITQLLQVDHEAHGSTNDDPNCITLRRYAGMSLTNLTFGDGKNKALLCSFNKFLRALVDQLKSPSEDLRQVTASVLRNLSWRADSESKQALRNVGAVIALTVSAMEGKKESTLKSILSALWNLSAHCSSNKVDICSVPGALAFLVKMLRYKSSSNTLAIVENAGGILRNISSHIAVREDYRQILRDNNCFEVLLEQLKSPSLTVVSNACGTLWNLSARCSEDQKRLWEMGATAMLRSLVQSKHKMIAMGSSAALKNLLTANPDESLITNLDSTAKSLGLQNLPTLFVRKKKALEQELNITLAETCDNIDHPGSPTHCEPSQEKSFPKRSESRDSVQSSQSDSVYERIQQMSLKNEEKGLENVNTTLHDSLDEKSMPRKVEDQKLMRRYRSSMIPTPTFKKMNQDRINVKTKEETVVEDRVNETVSDSKQRNKKGIPVLNTRIKSRASQSPEINETTSLQSSDRSFEVNVDEIEDSRTQEQFVDSKTSSDEFNESKEFEIKKSKQHLKNFKYDIPQILPSTTVNVPTEEKVNEIMSSEQSDLEKPECMSFSSDSSNQDLDNLKISGSFKDGSKSFLNTQCDSNNVNANIKGLSGGIAPKFKVGSPITAPSVLKFEADKICREIKKQQDFDMGCSLTSEVSLISCSSFLDTGDYSLFDSSTEVIDFDDSLGKNNPKVKNLPFRKLNISQTAESVSLPSLGSLKNDQIDALDLDNSVLSVASIISEIAETNPRDFDTFTKTFEKNDAENEIMEETAADVTLVSDGDDTLNADSLQNCELLDEDNSILSQENLPLDPGSLHLEKTNDMINKKLTPKEKRKTFQDRYRTYTIRNFQDSKLSGRNFIAESSTTEVPEGCAQVSNQLDNGLNRCSFDYNDETHWKTEREKFDLPLQKGKNYEKFYFSKSLDKEQYGVPGLASDSRSLTDLLSIGPNERKELVDNAKLVAFSLKTAVHEGEVNSDSEVEDDHKSVEIDTATYSKSNRDRFFGKFSSQGLQAMEQYEEVTSEEDVEKKGARVLKPTDKPDEKLENPKGIRGRRKPLYSSPRKISPRATTSSNSPTKISKVAIATKKPSDSSPVLHRQGTFTKEEIPVLEKVEAKTTRTISTQLKNSESKGLNISRPPCKIKPVSPVASKRGGENQVSRIGRPLSSYASKYSERRAELDSSHKRPYSAGAGNRNIGERAADSTKAVSSGLISPKMRSSSSNQNIKTGNTSGSFVKTRNPALQSSKSQSDASLNFVASKDKDASERTPKKEVSSKIASLWKKVEETKQRNQNIKDNRVWICPEKNVNTTDEVLVIEKEEILDIPTRKIVHSYTCQALADEPSASFGSQETVCRDREERGRKAEKRKIISAVIPPFNYNPPRSAQVLPTKVKQVDPFPNGSLKVTTV